MDLIIGQSAVFNQNKSNGAEKLLYCLFSRLEYLQNCLQENINLWIKIEEKILFTWQSYEEKGRSQQLPKIVFSSDHFKLLLLRVHVLFKTPPEYAVMPQEADSTTPHSLCHGLSPALTAGCRDRVHQRNFHNCRAGASKHAAILCNWLLACSARTLPQTCSL